MEYKKIIKNNITIHNINTDRFKTLSVVVFFTKEFDKNDIAFGNFLTNNLVYSSKKYNTKTKMATKGEELYGAKVSASYCLLGKCESFIFSLDFLNPIYTEDKYLDESLLYLKEILFNPNVKENSFDIDYFNIIKNDLVSSSKAIKDNPNLYAGIKYSQIMYKGTPSAYSTTPTLEDIEKVTPENLYSFYKDLFDGNYKIDIAILGQTNDDIIDKVYDIFKNIKSNNKSLQFKIEHKYEDKVIEKIDSLPFNQSKLYIGYRLNNLTNYELNYVLRVYNTILGTMNDSILFNIVREANSLCYTVGSYYSKYNPSLTIYAGINKVNYEKAVDLIKSCVESMKNEKVLKRLFDSAKKTINTYLNNYYDDLSAQINHYYDNEFDTIEDVETQRENINKVTIDEVIKLNDKIKLSTIYLMRGDNND